MKNKIAMGLLAIIGWANCGAALNNTVKENQATEQQTKNEDVQEVPAKVHLFKFESKGTLTLEQSTRFTTMVQFSDAKYPVESYIGTTWWRYAECNDKPERALQKGEHLVSATNHPYRGYAIIKIHDYNCDGRPDELELTAPNVTKYKKASEMTVGEIIQMKQYFSETKAELNQLVNMDEALEKWLNDRKAENFKAGRTVLIK